MAPKIVVVTGANFGIGFEAVKAFLQSPNSYHVYLGSRSVEKGTQAIEQLRAQCPQTKNTVELLQVDLGSDASIEKAFEKVKNGPGHVDVLINNAGMYNFRFKMRPDGLLTRSFRRRLRPRLPPGQDEPAGLLQPGLRRQRRGYQRHDLELHPPAAQVHHHPAHPLPGGPVADDGGGRGPYFPTPPLAAGWPKKDISFETIGYRCSKTALSMLMLDWNHKLQADGVKVFSVSPGFCATGLGGLPEEMTKAMGAVHPSEGGQRLIAVAEGKRDADAGKILDKEGFIPW
ncbi:hypothetical protein PG988_006329 [Apiospora saccharicola]